MRSAVDATIRRGNPNCAALAAVTQDAGKKKGNGPHVVPYPVYSGSVPKVL